MSTTDPNEDALAENAADTHTDEESQPGSVTPDKSRRRRLSKDEERDIAQLYAAASTPTSAIRERFGIGDSSLYRVLQRYGIALRGRTGASPQSSPSQTQAVGTRRQPSSSVRGGTQHTGRGRRSTTASGDGAGVGNNPPGSQVGQPAKRRPGRPATRAQGTPSLAGSGRMPSGASASLRFEVRFQGESVVQATDIGDALRQAESLGATQIMEIVQQE